MKLKAIVSDADGTLVNTLYLIRHGQYETATAYLRQKNFPEERIPSYEIYEHHINEAVGGSAHDTLERTMKLLFKNSPGDLEGMDYDALHELLNPIQDAIAPEYVKPYPGLADLLGWVGSVGIRFAVFTSGTRHHIVRNFGVALPELGCSDLFRSKELSDKKKLELLTSQFEKYFGISQITFVTHEDVTLSKPDPASINVALRRLVSDPGECMVIGDHSVDMQAAVRANINLRVGVTHGFAVESELQDAGATDVIKALDEIPALLQHKDVI